MKKMSIFALLLAAVLVTSYSVSGTYAKYTSSATGTDSARVAKWSFTVGGTEIATSNEFTFDLFNTVKDSDANNDESDVKVGQGETIIAPGTQGSFDIVLANASEVNAIYDVAYTVTNSANIPVEFRVGEGQWTSNISTLDVNDKAINMNGGTETIRIQWRWVFEVDENGNTVDTTLGTAGTDTITVTAKVTATQVD